MILDNNKYYNFKLNNILVSGLLIKKEKHKCLHCKTNKNCLVFIINNKEYHIGITCLSKIFKSLKDLKYTTIDRYDIVNKDKFLKYFDEPRENEYNMYFDFDSINDNI